jgi:small subunit ribosomal protein S17e
MCYVRSKVPQQIPRDTGKQFSREGWSNLGKVRIDVVKKTARELLERYPNKFTTDFEENKQLVVQLVNAQTKWMRNRIAGYVTTLRHLEEKRKAVATATPEEVSA